MDLVTVKKLGRARHKLLVSFMSPGQSLDTTKEGGLIWAHCFRSSDVCPWLHSEAEHHSKEQIEERAVHSMVDRKCHGLWGGTQ